MDESEQEVRPGSDNSENGFVEVTREDAQVASQSWEQPSSLDDDADLYGSGDAGDDGVGEDDEVAAAVELEQEKVRKRHTQRVSGWVGARLSWEFIVITYIYPAQYSSTYLSL